MSKKADNDITNSLGQNEIDAIARLIFEGYANLDKKPGTERYKTITLTGPTWVGLRGVFSTTYPGDQLSGEISYWFPGWEYLVGPREKRGGQSNHGQPGVTVRPQDFEPLTLRQGDEYYLNPRLGNVGDGKKRIYVSRLLLMSLGVPPEEVTSSGTLVLVHAVVWRWCAGMPVPGGIQVSHVGDAPLVVTPARLVGEPGPYNRSRTVCGQGLLAGAIPNALCIRCRLWIQECFHYPQCTYPAPSSLGAGAFAAANAPGLPRKVRVLHWCHLDTGAWAPDFPLCYRCHRAEG